MDLIEPQNSICNYFIVPPQFSLEEIASLPKPTESLMQLWEAEKYHAVMIYKQQNNIESTDMIAWYLWCCSKLLQNMKNPKTPIPKPLV